MHKMIGVTFKTILMCIFTIIVADVSLFSYDLYNVYSKTNKIMDIVERDVSEHNGLPEAMADVYRGMLDDVVEKSYIVHSYATNFSEDLGDAQSLAYDGDPSAGSDVVVYEYGDLIDVSIKIRLGYSLAIVNFAKQDNGDNNIAEFTSRGTSVINTDTSGYLFTVDIDFAGTVPALRYLK